MADVFIWDGATGAADGSTWADAYTTLAAALSGAANNDDLIIAHNHNEALGTGNTNFTAKSGYANSCTLTSCTQQASGTTKTYNKATASQFGTSTNNYAQFLNSISCYGIYMITGGNCNLTPSNGQVQEFYDCTFECSTADNNSYFTLNNEGYAGFVDCTFVNSRTGVDNQPYCSVGTRGLAVLHNCTFAPTVAVTRFTGALISGTAGAECRVYGGDASTLTSLASIINDVNQNAYLSIYGLKPPSGVTVTAVAESQSEPMTVGGVAESRTIEHDWVHGNIVDSVAYTRTGGASDGTAYSWLVTTTSACRIGREICTPWIELWVDTAASTTFTARLTSATAFTDTEVWLELYYPGGAVAHEKLFDSSRNASYIGTGTALSTTTPGTWSPADKTEQKIASTVTLTEKGIVMARVCIAKASVTDLYICSKIDVS